MNENIPSREFTKPALRVDQQINLLAERGLQVSLDRQIETRALNKIGYYRLSGYFKGFQDESDRFLDNTSFRKVLNIYLFDKNLRSFIFDSLEQIEVALRTVMTNILSNQSTAFWYNNEDFFQKGKHIASLKNAYGVITDPSKSTQSIKHYLSEYYKPSSPPSWMVLEAFSFGKLYHMFKNLRSKYQRQIAREFYNNHRLFCKFLHCLTYLRNLSAHHKRIWNRQFTIKPTYPTSQPEADVLASSRPTSFYPVAYIIHLILEKVSIEPNNWAKNLEGLFQKYPDVEYDKLGFPTNWTQKKWE
jgi:abortive infection bacteriophage resistance protein